MRGTHTCGWNIMLEYFASPMGIGRYPKQTVGEIFSSDRYYFDQLLRKNLKFRKCYATAYKRWSEEICCQKEPEISLFSARITLAITIIGEVKMQNIFASLLQILKKEGLTPLPHDLCFSETLPGREYDRSDEYQDQMRRIRLFWSRLAVPDVREDE
jgi:hypothetical protein